MESLRDQIQLITIFRGGHAQPYMFAWNGRTYKVKALHGYHTSKRDGATVYQWSVTANDNVYVLEWNNSTLEATLTGIEEKIDLIPNSPKYPKQYPMIQ